MTANWAEARLAIDTDGSSRLRTGPEQKGFVRRLRRGPTLAEAALWERLRTKQTGYRLARQRTILQYVVDFFCPATGLVIEVDGGYHNSTPELAAYETRRDRELSGLGLTVIRFSNKRVLGDLDGVVAEITTRNERLRASYPLRSRWFQVNGARIALAKGA